MMIARDDLDPEPAVSAGDAQSTTIERTRPESFGEETHQSLERADI